MFCIGCLCILSIVQTKTSAYEKMKTCLLVISSILCFVSSVSFYFNQLIIHFIFDLFSRLLILCYIYTQLDPLLRDKKLLKIYTSLALLGITVSLICIALDPMTQVVAVFVYVSLDVTVAIVSLYVVYLVIILVMKKKKLTCKQIVTKELMGPGGTGLISFALSITSFVLFIIDFKQTLNVFFTLLLAARICLLQIYSYKLSSVIQKRANLKDAMQIAQNAKRNADDQAAAELAFQALPPPLIIAQPKYEEFVPQSLNEPKIKVEKPVIETPGPEMHQPDSVQFAQNNSVTIDVSLAGTNHKPGRNLPLIQEKILSEDSNFNKIKTKLDISTVRIQVKAKGVYSLDSGIKKPPLTKKKSAEAQYIDMEVPSPNNEGM
jgi:heme exporter protein D